MSDTTKVPESNTWLLDAAERVRSIVQKTEERRSGVEMTLDEWRRMHHYTCSLPTSPRPGFVYATGPHKRDSDPTTDPWWLITVVASAEPGYVDHVPKRIFIKDAPLSPEGEAT